MRFLTKTLLQNITTETSHEFTGIKDTFTF